MKITDITTILVHAPIPEKHRVESGAGQKFARQGAFVEIHTDEGISGVGPVSFGSATMDLFSVEVLVERVIKPTLVGKDPFDIHALWDTMYHGIMVRVFGTRGMGQAIMSGIDIALYDIKGKALGVPVYQLLGGAYHDNGLPSYASSIYWSDDPKQAGEHALQFREMGFKATKLKVGANWRNDLRALAAIRDAVGDTMDVMVDANQAFSASLALKVGKELEQYDVLFFEEPTSIDDIRGHAQLTRGLTVPIATGENMYTRFAFRDFIVEEAIDIIQPDPARIGGLTEAKRTLELAAAFNLNAAPHTFGDAVSLVASVHLMMSTANVIILEVDQTYNPLISDLVTEPLKLVDGRMQVPQGPGLGIELNRDFIKAHPYTGERGIALGYRPTAGLVGEELWPKR